MSSKPLLLLFGYGPRTGKAVADVFANAGYRIAATSRSLKDGPVNESFLNIKADLSDPNVVAEVYKKTQAYFNAKPNAVIYNVAALSRPQDGPLSLSLSQVGSDINFNLTSLYAAASEAVRGFESLPEFASKTFMFLGNKQSHGLIIPSMISLGIGKSAAAYIIGSCAAEYSKKGFNFYYVDQRTEEGKAVYNDVDGPAHGEFLLQLAASRDQGPWEATFVKGKGYVKFAEWQKL